MITIGQAIMSLRPGVEWTLSDENIENIIWHSPNVEPLTSEEIELEMIRLEKQREQDHLTRQEARQSGLAKLKKLGLTIPEIQSILD